MLKPGCLTADYIIQFANSIPSFYMKTILGYLEVVLCRLHVAVV